MRVLLSPISLSTQQKYCTSNNHFAENSDPPINDSSTLLYNVPNPTADKTTIYFNLADDIPTAQIRITDIYGKVIEIIPVSNGSTSIEFNCTTCYDGIYFYSLIVGDELISTKKMVIPK